MKVICLIVPSLVSGGTERVMSEIANYLANREGLRIHLVTLIDKDIFYELSPNVVLHKPEGIDSRKPIKIFIYLRNKIKEINPYSILSFGAMYNSFVLISSVFLKQKIFVSDRSNPLRNNKISLTKGGIERHDGLMHFFLKKILYKSAAGIIVQTECARKVESKNNRNVILIPNPVRLHGFIPEIKPGKFILNVGRFIDLKQQDLLIKIFSEVDCPGWTLMFAGDGPNMERAKMLVKDLNIVDRVIFLGNVRDIQKYYNMSDIFAFTSASEGFPNALAEALATPLASISFNCNAGPADLIQDGYNGFLVDCFDVNEYKNKLMLLASDESLRTNFKINSIHKMKNFDSKLIMEKYYAVVAG